MTWLLALLLADPSAILSLFSHTGMARGCPVGERTILTSRHVAVQEREIGPRPLSMVWSDGSGQSGNAWTLDYDLRRDLAVMTTDRPVSKYYQRAANPPQIGEQVVIAGYKFNDRLQMRTITTRVVNLVAAHLVLSDGAESGFSGSCVLNAQNEVVGVFQWSLENRGQRRGIASAVYGEWGDISWVPPTP